MFLQVLNEGNSLHARLERHIEWLADHWFSRLPSLCQFAVGLYDHLNRVFQVFAGLSEGSALRIRARQLLHIAYLPVAVLLENGRKCRSYGV